MCIPISASTAETAGFFPFLLQLQNIRFLAGNGPTFPWDVNERGLCNFWEVSSKKGELEMRLRPFTFSPLTSMLT